MKTIKKRLKKWIRIITGVEIMRQIKIETERCGNDYGGFEIVPELLGGGNPIVYSFGVGEDISFDKYLMDKYNAEIWAFDPTPKSIAWVKQQEIGEKFHFYEIGLSKTDGSQAFYLPKNKEYVSGSVLQLHTLEDTAIYVEMRSFHTILSQLKPRKIDILKMDIEGSEYMVIPDILESNVEIGQICMEIHGYMLEDGKRKNKELIRMMNAHNYKICAVKNNTVITFIKGHKI